MKTPPIAPGDTIGVMAPSSFVERTDIEKSKALLEERGYKIVVHDQTYARHHQSAGTHTEKIDALHALYADPSIKAIWAAGGGNRALYLLNDLDYALIKANPKPLIGFSDVTVLLNAISAHTGVENIHGQVFKNLHKPNQISPMLALLTGTDRAMPLQNAQILKTGTAQGRLVGGNLSLFQYLIGTPDCQNLKNAILFLEDCGDEISRFDRMFAHLARRGVFEEISALVLGTFSDLRDSGTPFGFTLQECVLENLKNRNIPIVFDAPFGHGKELLPLPLNAIATLDTAQKILKF